MKEAEVQLGRNDTNDPTSYQMEMLTLAAMGLSTKEIAEKLCLEQKLVVNLFKNVCHKLGVSKRHQALILAINSEWLDPEQCVGQSNLSLFETLTSRQLDVVELIAMGKTNSEIAEELFFSTRTIVNDLNKVYSSLEIKAGDNSRKRGRAAVLYHAYRKRSSATKQQPTS